MSQASSREEELFHAALELPPGEQRAAFLRRECADDEVLRHRVETLVRAHEDANAVFESAMVTVRSATTSHTPVTEKAGDRIGRYRLQQEIGEGGCGVVYMAEQQEPVRRRVALKIIKLGMDTRQVVARFEAERQALAMMDHPNIAKVLDAGATETGRPFFVMELVRGVPITEYCDKNNLSTRERLALFIPVCKAIQHAHQKGVIHRDIKPSNILVTLHDGVPVPKVIDFGIAKAIDQPLTEKTLFTRFEQFMGTPAYMSPEQAEMSGLDIDTRSDIYSLGVLLYELLTGKTPFDPKELASAGLEAMRKAIREKEPMRPSTRINTLPGEDRTTTAKRRGADAPKLISLIQGDLDWIAMKCLEKDRTRRYETANGLVMDIERYLHNEPVVARPPSATYRFQKLVRRNKLVFASAGAVVIALVIGLAVATWMFFQEKRARQRAVAAEATARTEAAKSQQVAQFLQDMLKGVGPATAQGRDTTMLREILDQTEARVGTDLKSQPLVEAELRAVLGQVYHGLGLYPEAETMYRQALRLYESAGGNDQRAGIASVLNNLGLTQVELNQLPDAERTYSDALEMNKALYGPVHANVAASLYGLAETAWHRGDLIRAEAKYREELALLRQLVGERHPKVTEVYNDLGLVLLDRGNLSEAEALFRKAVAIGEEILGGKHPEVLIYRNDLALALWYRGELEEAEQIFRHTLAMETEVLGEGHPQLAYVYNNLALVLRDRGKLVESEEWHRRCFDLLTKAFGEQYPLTIRARNNLSFVLRRRGAQAADATALIDALRLNPTDQLSADAFASLMTKPSLTPLLSGQSEWRVSNDGPDAPDAAWLSAPTVFGTPTFLPRTPKTPITVHTNLWLRREFELPSVPAGKIVFCVNHNHDAQIFLNGIQAAPVADWSDTDVLVPCSPTALQQGRNVLTLHCEDADGRAPIDIGLYVTPDTTLGRNRLIETLGQLIEKELQRDELYAARANAFARLGLWKEALADLTKAVALKPDAATSAYQLAPLLLQSDDVAGYRQHRLTALDRFAKPDTSIAAQQIAELALLMPAEGDELTAAAKLAAAAAAADYPDWNLPWRQLTKGLAEYRQGRFASAIEWMNKALATGAQKSLPAWNHERERNRAAVVYLVQAMARHGLGQMAEARADLAKGKQIALTQFPALDSGDLGREWQDMLIARILLREATTLIEGGTGGASPDQATHWKKKLEEAHSP